MTLLGPDSGFEVQLTRKRARTQFEDASDDGAVVEAQKAEDIPFQCDVALWLEDGNLILRTNDRIGFRIYKGLLCKQSPVFASMLSGVMKGGPATDGCPVIDLTDSAADLRHLLQLILPTSPTVHWSLPHSVELDAVSALIRLSHKYQLHNIRDQSLDMLHTLYPSTLSSWLHLDSSSASRTCTSQAIAAVNCARLVGDSRVLPTALYACCATSGTVVHGYARPDGVLEHLSADDLACCMDGRDRLARESVARVFCVFEDRTSARCSSRSACRKALRRIAAKAGKMGSAEQMDAFAKWEPRIRMWAREEGLCEKCVVLAVERYAGERRRLWRQLPQIFGVEVSAWDGMSKEEWQEYNQADGQPEEDDDSGDVEDSHTVDDAGSDEDDDEEC